MLKNVLKIGGGFVAGCVVWQAVMARILAHGFNVGEVIYEDDNIKVKRAANYSDGTKCKLAWVTDKQ